MNGRRWRDHSQTRAQCFCKEPSPQNVANAVWTTGKAEPFRHVPEIPSRSPPCRKGWLLHQLKQPPSLRMMHLGGSWPMIPRPNHPNQFCKGACSRSIHDVGSCPVQPAPPHTCQPQRFSKEGRRDLPFLFSRGSQDRWFLFVGFY